MNRSILVRCAVLVSLSLLFTLTVHAKGEFQRVSITDQQTGDVIQLTPEDSRRLTSFFIFNPFDGALATAPDVGEGYTIQRGYLDEEQFLPFDQVIYYPAVDNKRGYIHYIGLQAADGGSVGGWSEYDNHWYYIDRSAEVELRRFLTADPAPMPDVTPWWQGLFQLCQKPVITTVPEIPERTLMTTKPDLAAPAGHQHRSGDDDYYWLHQGSDSESRDESGCDRPLWGDRFGAVGLSVGTGAGAGRMCWWCGCPIRLRQRPA